MSIAITVGITIWMVFLFYISIKSIKNYKNEIVSLGVLGTFIGIAIGLFNFDVTNIKESMPYLLGGLKTAFITSGIGMFFSILLSLIKPTKVSTISLDDIANNQQQIIRTLEKSLQEISKTANEEIINSLEKVVKQFNNNLTNQFGENFKEFNCAIKEMSNWQKNYKDQLADYEEAIRGISINLKRISDTKEKQEKNIERVISNLASTSDDVSKSLKKATDIVEENLQLLLREANGMV